MELAQGRWIDLGWDPSSPSSGITTSHVIFLHLSQSCQLGRMITSQGAENVYNHMWVLIGMRDVFRQQLPDGCAVGAALTRRWTAGFKCPLLPVSGWGPWENSSESEPESSQM